MTTPTPTPTPTRLPPDSQWDFDHVAVPDDGADPKWADAPVPPPEGAPVFDPDNGLRPPHHGKAKPRPAPRGG